MEAAAERLLIRRAKAGDREAIADLIRAHHRPVEMFLLRLCGRPDLAEDLAQEAFMRVMRSLDRFDERFRFSTWLFTIAKRLLVNNLQKMKPTSDSDLVELRAAAYSTPASENEAQEEARLGRGMLDTALSALEEPQLEIVLLFHQQGWPVHRIAAQLKMPEGTIKSHLFRARRKMLGAIEAQQETATHQLRDVRESVLAARQPARRTNESTSTERIS
ncbi:MAG: sigma-70 family RNA polymerase sigma factor [Phycisphaerales bacterium]|nr:sigma-70 family RNA polymerase sigma factor [Phycisphaerales bacterium]